MTSSPPDTILPLQEFVHERMSLPAPATIRLPGPVRLPDNVIA